MNRQERERLNELLLDLTSTQASITLASVMRNDDVKSLVTILNRTKSKIISFVESLTEK